MSETLVWWVMVQVVGLAALPLCLTLFRRLPDRGYALSKPFALLLVGYLFWVLNVMRVLPNTTGGISLVLVLFFLASGYLLWRRRDELLAFVRERWWLIAAIEALFFLAFVTAAYLRSYVPDLGGTEKPMDFMFLNAVTRGEGFPPADPWLAGENVSYYYFGYLLVSIMTRLSDVFANVPTSVGYNLGLAMTVALAVTGAFGLVYNLAAPREEREAGAGPGTPPADSPGRTLWRPMAFGLAAGLLLAIMGNLEGLLELLAAHDFGSNGLWEWVSIRDPTTGELTLTSYDSSRWFPDQHWFWWRATRILDGGVGIHEVPFFSFLLGDLHPHVMSIPFVLLAVGAALALLRSEGPLDLVVWLERPLWLVAFGLILGGLAFLNTWDMPTMAFIFALIALLRNRLLADRWSWGLVLDTAGFVAPLFVVAFLAYIPFFRGGFTSQAAGFTAEAGAGSGLFHTFLLWGPFAALVLPYAAWRLTRSDQPVALRAVLWSLAPAAAILALWVVWDLLAKASGWLPPTIRLNEAGADLWSRIGERGWNWLTVLAMGSALGLLGLSLVREVEAARRSEDERLGHIFALALSAIAALLILGAEFIFIHDTFGSRMNTIFKLYYQAWLLLSVAGGFALYELTRGWRLPAIGAVRAPTFTTSLGDWSLGELVVLTATFAGAIAGIAVTPDLLTRIIGAVVGAGILFVVSAAGVLLWRATAPRLEARVAAGALTWRALWAGGATVVLLAALVYPLLATFNRTNAFDLPRRLDGLANLPRDEYAAIQWLAGRDGQPVVAEALGDDYTEGGRISAATGLPTLLQWPGHQLQWRGTSEPQKDRPEDLELLYTSSDPDEVKSVIQKYDIAYIYLGPRERARYPDLMLPEMSDLFAEPCPDQQADQQLCSFQQGEVIIYRVRPGILSEATQE